MSPEPTVPQSESDLMPSLELDPADLEPLRAELTIAYLESVMLSPDNEADRMRLKASRVRAECKGLIKKLCPTERSFDNGEIATLLDLLDAAPRPEEVFQERQRKYELGTVAGWILWDCLAGHDGVPVAGLTATKAKISERLQQRGRKRGFSLSSLENTAWRTYEPVAHFCLAHMLRQVAVLPCARFERPCAPNDLIRFLAVSEHLRRAAELIKLRKSSHSLLDPARTWKVPSSIQLPVLILPDDAKKDQVWFAVRQVPSIAGASGSSLRHVPTDALREVLRASIPRAGKPL